jgi:hypothetical protein
MSTMLPSIVRRQIIARIDAVQSRHPLRFCRYIAGAPALQYSGHAPARAAINGLLTLYR